MDALGPVEVILNYLPNRRIHIDFSATNNRQPHPESALEASIHTAWQGALRQNPALFNGPKFRLASVSVGQNHQATFHLGLTDYKTFQGTHSGDAPVQRFGRRHMACPLGNVVIAETDDHLTVLISRNQRVGEGKGAVAFPGGHPEPHELTPPPVDGDNSRVAEELWEGARRELLEELFLEEHSVQSAREMQCLGLVERKRDAKATQVFYARVYLTGEEVEDRYREGNVAMEESDNIILLPMRRLKDIAKGEKVDRSEPVAELVGGALLWQQMAEHLQATA
eukprot:GFKZ01000027.1.p2 GENE.GFKZ01000027.1~~GFKZ01000027.1.p2  ORF type:complete len:281 (+),score=40.54 GFKZ01000027.1:121-963(+)